MTIDEYRTALDALTDPKFREFGEKFGGGQVTREARVQAFAYSAEHERDICFRLGQLGVQGLRLENEKVTEAAVQSANAAQESAAASKESARVAALSLTVAIAAALIAIVTVALQILP